MTEQPKPIYKDSVWWSFGLSMLWFANNYKWFILMLAILPMQVRNLVPDEVKNTYWGAVFTGGAIWAAFGPTIMGGWSDRVGRRRIFMIVGMAMTLVSLAILGSANAFWMIVVGYLALQVSDDVMQGAYASMIPQFVPKEKQPRASAILSALNLFAQIATVLAAIVLGSQNFLGMNGLQLIYLGIGIVNLVSLILVLVAVRSLHEPIPKLVDSAPVGFWQDLMAPWASLDFRWVWASRLMINLGFFIIQPYISNFLKDSVGTLNEKGEKVYGLFGLNIVGAEQATYVVLLTLSLAGGVGALLSIKRMPSWGLKKTIWSAGFVLAPVLLCMAFVRDFHLMFFLAMAFGFAHGTFLSADWALGAATVPNPDSLGKDMGIWSSAVVFAQVTAGFCGGAIDGLNRVQGGLGYLAAFAASAVLMGLGTQLVRKVKGAT